MKSTILYLDDSPLLHARVKSAFGATDMEIVATDSVDAVKSVMLSGTPPSLLLLDLEMPDADGRNVGRAFKRRYRDVPIVVFSSESDERLAEAVAMIGAETGISKRSTDAELVAAVTAILRRSPPSTN